MSTKDISFLRVSISTGAGDAGESAVEFVPISIFSSILEPGHIAASLVGNRSEWSRVHCI